MAASFHLLICDIDLKELKPGSISRKRGEERQGKEKNRKERGGGKHSKSTGAEKMGKDVE